jgi:uncharacterized protein YdiU (UPF0061 family)
MFHLGLPTTRAGTIVSSDTYTQRDPLYDGSAIEERCCIVSRIAPNFFRFGSFEVFLGGETSGGRAGPSARNEALKQTFVDFVISSFYPECESAGSGGDKYQRFFDEVMRRTAELVAQWQAFGFVHGVLNTDNMSVMGLTIDYGPFAFMELFDPDFTPNASDGKYNITSRHYYSTA